MNIDELSQIWHSADKDLEKSVKLNKALLKDVTANKIRSSLNEIKWENFIEIAANLFVLTLLIDYIQTVPAFKFFLPAALLVGLMVCSSVFSVYKLYLYYSIDSKNSVLQIQKNAEMLRYCELMETNSLMVIIPLFWVCFMIVIAHGVFGYDLYQHEGLLWNSMIGSFVVAFFVVVLLKIFPNKELKKSIDFLKELRER